MNESPVDSATSYLDVPIQMACYEDSVCYGRQMHGEEKFARFVGLEIGELDSVLRTL
jgi:hypothetical protein